MQREQPVERPEGRGYLGCSVKRKAKESHTQGPGPVVHCRPSGRSLTFTLNETINR